MTREEQIIEASKLYAKALQKPFVDGAMWADRNHDKKRVYTKKELIDMGFVFTLNGEIVNPKETEKAMQKYLEYKQKQWLDSVTDWLNTNFASKEYVRDNASKHPIVCTNYQWETVQDMLADLKEYMEEQQ